MAGELKFKTNINCSGCVAQVKPSLDAESGIKKWEVDTEGKNKILTVQADEPEEKSIIEAVQKAGFKIERI